MRVAKVQIDGFGTLRDRVYELNGPLTVLYGPNEAGKSTLMNFMRYVLFGYPSRGSFLRYDGTDGTVHGGALTLTDEAGRLWRVERYEGRTGARGRSGEARVTLDDGTSGGEALLASRLGGMSGELYRSLYAFGLGELQELRLLQADEVAAFLYGAGFGGSGAAIRDTERRLQLRMEELYRPRGRNQPIAQTVKALDELDAALRRSRDDAARYEARREELSALDAALAALAERGMGVRERADWLAQCVKARPQWLALRALEREWAETPAFPSFPEAAVSRWETLAAERDALLAQRERLGVRRSRVEERLEALGPAAVETAGRGALLQLLERAPLYEQAEREALQLGGERRQLAERLTGLLRSLDAEWDEDLLRSVPVTVALREQVRGHRERLAALAQEGERLQAELAQAKQRAADAADELRQADAEADAAQRQAAMRYPWPPDAELPGDDDPARLVVAIRRDYGEWQRLAAEAAHVRERQGDERRHREQLRQASGDAADSEGAKVRAYALPMAALALGALLGAWLYAAGQRPAAAVAAAALAALALLLHRQQRRPGPRPARRGRAAPSSVPADDGALYGERLAALAAQQQLLQQRLQERVGRLTATPLSAAALEPPVGGADAGAAMPFAAARGSSGASAAGEAAAWEATRAWLDGALDDWERLAAGWHREREAVRRRLERLAELQHAAARARELQLQAERRLEALAARRAPELAAWQAWLRELRFPPHMSPEAALEALRLIEQGHALLAQIDALDAKAAEIRADRAAFDREVAGFLQLMSGESALSALRRWKEADERDLAVQTERDRLAAELSGIIEEAEALGLRLHRHDERASELLTAAHAADEQELRANARLDDRRRRLEEERLSTFAALEAWVGDRPLERLDGEWYGKDDETVERELHTLKSRLQQLEKEEQELRDRRGRLAGELERLESGGDHADRLQRRQELTAQLQRQAEEWTELAMAAALFRRTRELFEREKQPQVLQRASAYFARLTEGRYSRIVAPLGEQKLLAMRPDGETLDPGKLSRGTAEQLYLAMRFAIASEAEHSRLLPLLLDDILVNFDETRTRQTLRLVNELAQTRHIMLFTCHAHIVRAAAELLPGHERIDL